MCRCLLTGCFFAIAGSFSCSSKNTQDDSGDSGSGGSGFNPDAGSKGDASQNCGQSKIEAKPRPVNVAIVLDRSLSMNTALSATEPKTRWQAMRQALNVSLTAVQDRVSFGLKLFPDGTADCAVSNPGLTVDIGQGASIISQIDQTIGSASPGGGTPIADALSQVYDYFTAGLGSTLVGDRVVLLATDGAPNCNASLTCDSTTCIANIENSAQTQNICQYDPSQCLDDAQAEAQVKRLFSQGIRSVVVGIPGTEYTQYQAVLNRLGAAGGLANPDPTYDYFPVSADAGIAGLQSTLESITSKLIVSCKLQLTSIPPEVGLLNVVVDGQAIPQSSSDGWGIDSSTVPPTVVLKGSTCQRMETQGAQSVDITYGCPTVIN